MQRTTSTMLAVSITNNAITNYRKLAMHAKEYIILYGKPAICTKDYSFIALGMHYLPLTLSPKLYLRPAINANNYSYKAICMHCEPITLFFLVP